MLELAILGLLREQPRHGYELRRQLADYGFWSVSFGSLYPALRRLERKGLIAAADSSGRRKSYVMTDEGRTAFAEMMADPSDDGDDERAFNLRLAFFRYLEPDDRLGVLERRREQLSERLARGRASLRRTASRTKERMDRYTLSLMEHGVRSAEADIAWLDELIETERNERRRSRRGGAPGAAGAPAMD